MKKRDPVEVELRARRDAIVQRIAKLPAVRARRAAFERAERLETAAWLKTGKKPAALSRRADALYKAVGRRFRSTKNPPPTPPRVGGKRIYLVRGPGGQIVDKLANPPARKRKKNPMTSYQYDAERRRQRARRALSPGMKAHRQRRQLAALQKAGQRAFRISARPSVTRAEGRGGGQMSDGKHRALIKAHARAKRVTRASATKRRAQLDQAIRRLERTGSISPWSGEQQQRSGKSAAGPRARRLLALQKALHRRMTVTGNPPRKRGSAMARLARNRKGQFLPRGRRTTVANPSRKRRRKGSHRKTARRRVTRSHPTRHRRARRRNPSFGGIMATLKSSVMPMGVGGLAGLGAGYMDARFLGTRPTISILAKVGLAVLGAALMGKRHPLAAAGWAGGMMGSTGYHAGVNLGGGMVGLSPSGALKGIADMSANDPELANLIAGMGDVVEVDDSALGDAADEYNEALADVDDDMGDVVEAEG
jgi:hypothetical protein